MKWLIVRYSAIGDCAMAAHVPSRIRRAFPEARIDWVVESRCGDVVDTELLCNRKLISTRDYWKSNRWSPRRWRDALSFFASLRQQSYDYGLDLQGHSKTALCLRIAKTKNSLAIRGTDPLARVLNPIAEPPPYLMHTVEMALQCLDQLMPLTSDSTPIMPKLESERQFVRSAIPLGKPLATISVGASKSDRVYSPQNWVQVGSQLIEMGFNVAFLGGPKEVAPKLDGAIDLVGRLTLAQSMAAIAMSSISLATDTGTGHIAAAYDVPIVSIFGPADPIVFRPYTEKGIVLRVGKSTNAVSPAQVVDAAQCLVERYGRVVFD